jgi:hypothetical protein
MIIHNNINKNMNETKLGLSSIGHRTIMILKVNDNAFLWLQSPVLLVRTRQVGRYDGREVSGKLTC